MVFNSRNGWLNPQGQFFSCEVWEHDNVITLVFPDSDNAVDVAEKLGWIKLRDAYPFVEASRAPNDDQLKVLFDYIQEFDITLPAYCYILNDRQETNE
ncbi:MAG: hypothetical protein WC389_19905 [Lutibacter sp.]|jgi:hypothetical protein